MATSLGKEKLHASCKSGGGWAPTNYSCPRHSTSVTARVVPPWLNKIIGSVKTKTKNSTQ